MKQNTIFLFLEVLKWPQLNFVNLFRCVVALFVLSRCVPLRSWNALFLTSADNSFPLYPFLPSPLSPPHTHSSPPSPHAPPSWGCHLSAPAQSLLRPTAHLPPAPLTAPVANAKAHTYPHPLRHTKGCSAEPHLPWWTCRPGNIVPHTSILVCLCTWHLGLLL